MAPTASTEEIRRCYHALALQLHPDKASEEQVCSLDDGRLAPLTPLPPLPHAENTKEFGAVGRRIRQSPLANTPVGPCAFDPVTGASVCCGDGGVEHLARPRATEGGR